MTESTELAAWAERALETVVGDVARARALVTDAMTQLVTSFRELSTHLAEERQRYQEAVDAIAGPSSDQGLVNVMRDILQRFVDDIVNISRRSVLILMEVENLRGHADEVAARGQRIDKIAQATRVISLNAGIEARRVGQGGSVFRVVAEEIKVLANETSELSKAISAAITRQAQSLGAAYEAASQLAASDLDVAVQSHKHLGVTIRQLERVSASSLRALGSIQDDIDGAIRALQFEDMLTQLLDSVISKLTAIRATCVHVANGGDRGVLYDTMKAADERIGRDAVHQHGVAAGGVELF